MSYIMVDIESDGPCPGLYSMISFGAVVVGYPAEKIYKELAPITDNYDPEALKVCNLTREETLRFPLAEESITEFYNWVSNQKKPMFVSDNNGFDWQFVNYYFHLYMGDNPFGHSSMNLGSFYKGAALNVYENFKHLRKTKHTHNALDDAMGNAEAMIEIKRLYPELKIHF